MLHRFWRTRLKGSVMSRICSVIVCLGISSALVACNNEPPAQDAPAAGTAAPAPGVAGTTGAGRDADFLREQLAVGEKQVGLAKLVSERAASPSVKAYGERLVREYQHANDQLRRVAAEQGLNAAADARQLNVEGNRLAKLSGQQFDREYLIEIVADHEDAVNDLETASKGDNAAIRQWAATTLPIVRRSLAEARHLQKTTAQGGQSPQ
jgi:putative membrane protein